MITRRGFIALLLTLPLVGKLFARPAAKRQIFSFSFGRNASGTEIPSDCGNHLFKMIQAAKGDSPYYMPDADQYIGLDNEISGNGAYPIGAPFLLPKMCKEVHYSDPVDDSDSWKQDWQRQMEHDSKNWKD